MKTNTLSFVIGKFWPAALVLLLGPGLLAAAPAAAAPPPTAAPLSLEFIQNKGQWPAATRLLAPLPGGGQLLLENQGLAYVLADAAGLARFGHHLGEGTETGAATAAATTAADNSGSFRQHAYRVAFVGARADLQPVPAQPTAEVRNYFLGRDETRWAAGVGSFRQVRYPAVWPGIDVVLRENAAQRLEYDLLLAPRADPARAVLRYAGPDGLRLDEAGNLLIGTSVGTVRELAPQAWQTGPDGQRQPVPCRFVLAGQEVRFALGRYNRRRALTIDPTVVFSSSTGSTADNWGFTATYDQAGNLYSGGIVIGGGGSYPATGGAFSTQFSSVVDMALIKYNPAVNGPAARVWATYLGGNEVEFPHSLVVNAQNELLVLGSTSSTNYPTTAGAVGRTFGGGSPFAPFGASSNTTFDMPNGADLVLTRFSAAADRLLASTYLGGSGNDGVQATRLLARNYGDWFRGDVLLDAAGTVYVASNTDSRDFPGRPAGAGGQYQGGASDGVLCVLPPALTSVRSRFLGGSGADAAYSLQRDGAGRIFVAGGTTSPNLPTTAGAWQAAAPGNTDGFVARFDPSGQLLQRASYVGTPAYDQAFFVQLDNDGEPYLLGQTQGRPARTPGCYAVPGGGEVVYKLDPDLQLLRYATTFGKPQGISLVPTAFLVDECERVYVCGWGGRVNEGFLGGDTYGLPTAGGPVQTATDGSDFYLAEFTPGMTQLEYATFLGEQTTTSGEHVDGGTSRFDRRGVVYQAVCGGCRGQQGFPVPPGANTYAAGNGSANCNNAAFKLDFGRQQASAGAARAVCARNGAVPLGGAPAGGTWAGPGVVGTPATGYRFDPALAGPGPHVLRYTVAVAGACQATVAVRYTVPPATAVVFAAPPALCIDAAAAQLAASVPGGTFSGPGTTAAGVFSPQAAGPGRHTITYELCDSLRGSALVTQQLTVAPQLLVQAGPDTTLCADQRQPFQLRGTNRPDGRWSGPGVTPGGLFTPPDTNNRGGLFDLTYTVTQPPCTAADVRRVVLAPAALSNLPLLLPVCPVAPQYAGLAPFEVTVNALLPGGTYRWDFGDGTPVSLAENPTHRYEQPGSYRISLEARYANCETVARFAPLEIGAVFVPNIITPNRPGTVGDTLNESFRPRYSCRPASLKIFSRWGQQVYQTEAYHNDWNAPGLADGIYFYLLQDDEGRTQKGWLEVRGK